ncbi:hypothetical protein [Halomonas sp. OfavH-34-E]|uniref:hypothetical protein n=1 Tax=Halomonas sp. OfavH-34-E TaxID=2954491 RepID=UPI002096AD87|nr:hypothetical protein [Halomonas sp. OfavH-34-E]MCO7214139.1 hypothetical protein [Halomonas sp. OfavH-34-E]
MDKPYTFKDRSEVMSLEGVQDSPGVGPKNFSALLGDYHFPDDTLPLKCCCFKPGGRLCGQDHRNGYVVELTDGRKSLLGSTCVNEFGDGGNLSRLISQHNNQKRYEERITFVNNCYYSKELMAGRLSTALSEMKEVVEYFRGFKRSVPESVMRKLEGMARQGSGKVLVELISFKESVDERTGEVEREPYVTPHTVGQLPGLKFFHSGFWQSLMGKLEDMLHLVKSLEYMERGKTGYKKVATLYKKLEEESALLSEVSSYVGEKHLFEKSEKKPLCFLVPKQEERVKMVRMWWMESQGEPLSTAAAKQKLRELDDDLKASFGAEELRIP